MPRVSDRYESVSRGISEQPPQDRRPGQQTDQINMLSDPVRGLARRRGSIFQSDSYLGACTPEQAAASQADALSFKEYTFYVGAVEHSLFLRTAAKPTGSKLPTAVCMNKATGALLPTVRAGTDALLDQLDAGGASAYTSLGRFLYLAGNTITTTTTTHQDWANTANSRIMSAWVRSGAYSRTFTIRFKMADGSTKTASYTTKASSYPGVLDTSGISFSDPNYSKLVTDATNAYNSAVTSWIGQAAADITPQNIATKLLAAAVTAGITGGLVSGSHVLFPASSNIVEIETDDGGDDTAMRGTGAEVLNIDKLTNIHYVGKIVKVRPKSSDGSDAYYLKAVPKTAGTSGWTEVLWQECAGERHVPGDTFCFGTVKDGTLYLAGNNTILGTLISETVPGFSESAAGDSATNEIPQALTGHIDYLGVFQDRLVMGSKATMAFSRPGDYLNFFVAAVLTQKDDDPIEVFAFGGENDTITSSVYYDRNLVLFGAINQYSISGRTQLTPTQKTISVMTSHKDATGAPPISNGNLIFFGKVRDGVTSLHQIQAGVTAETPETAGVSQQLDTYLRGTPLELKSAGVPSIIALRTDELTHGFYLYSYLDTPAGTERLWDAWCKWEWNPVLGVLVGLAAHQRNFLTLTFRTGTHPTDGDACWLVVDRMQTATDRSDAPYLDSQIPVTQYRTPAADAWWRSTQVAADLGSAAFKASVGFIQFIGTPLSRLAELDSAYGPSYDEHLVVGINNDAYTIITNPYVRDRNKLPILSGRLVVSSLIVSFAKTGGFIADVVYGSTTRRALNFSGRLISSPSFLIGNQPIIDGQRRFSVGKETRECSIYLRAKTWLPFSVTGMEWIGQHYHH